MKLPEKPPALFESQHEAHWANRRAVGLGVFAGLGVAFAGYFLTLVRTSRSDGRLTAVDPEATFTT